MQQIGILIPSDTLDGYILKKTQRKISRKAKSYTTQVAFKTLPALDLLPHKSQFIVLGIDRQPRDLFDS